MRLTAIIAAAAFSLAACGADKSGTFDNGEGGEGTYDIDQDSENMTATFSDGKGGEMTMNTGEGVTATFPAGFSLYPGAKVSASATMSQGEGEGQMIGIDSDASMAKLVEFYKGQALDAGYQIEGEMNVGKMQMLNAKKDDGSGVSVQVMEMDEERQVRLMFFKDM